ncbi:uncharacterized protein C11orf16 homolog isoform X2 [Sphaerodactylus townsendi]|uniref:uncharacterized protein C11orf16 homolog isoform X2 n=1 Tax=Sphaerodactylus townsendi TaxID=933632 RepID=UPI0020261F20|nr:uncharacterized protein C11orf16 homolog isoform X2 [Sphaerodactylus townsendi]
MQTSSKDSTFNTPNIWEVSQISAYSNPVARAVSGQGRCFYKPEKDHVGELSKGMDNLWSSFPCHSHCWVMPTEAKHSYRNFITNPSLIYHGSLVACPACALRPFFPPRCLCLDRYPCFADTTCKAVKNLEESLYTDGTPVLARRDTDGYYYPGIIIKKVEGEKREFLVQFIKPFAEEGTTCIQTTASSDILEYVNGMRHSILPGDKVMAPWEPEQKRYGPGTAILGTEHRDPLRAKEDEEIVVSFWNGKKASVPLGVALWISPTQWKRIAEMINMPLTSRKRLEGQLHQASCRICSHIPVPASMHACSLEGLLKWQGPYCHRTCPSHTYFCHICSALAHRQCICCCLKRSGGLGHPFSAEFYLKDNKEDELSRKVFPQQLALEGLSKDQPAIATSSSSSCSSGSPSDEEQPLIKTTMVDQAVSTDSTLFYKPKLKESRRPDWKYWKRSHPRSFYNSQGTNILCSSYGKKRDETCTNSYADRSPTTLMNNSAMFETTEQSPRRLLTVGEVLTHEEG